LGLRLEQQDTDCGGLAQLATARYPDTRMGEPLVGGPKTDQQGERRVELGKDQSNWLHFNWGQWTGRCGLTIADLSNLRPSYSVRGWGLKHPTE